MFRKLFFGSLILILALGLRIFNYVNFPIGGETQDESAWTFLGASLIQEGQPTSWSYFSPYSEKYIYSEREDESPLVRPDLDHPPLFALLPGLAHTLKNDWQTFPSLKLIRLPMVLLGMVNVGLLMILAGRYFKKEKFIYLAGLIYATAPTFVFGSRLVVGENLLITWTLLALIALSWEKFKYRCGTLIVLGAVAILTKVSGVVIPISILIYGLMSGDKKASLSGLVGLVGGILLFGLYGAFYNFGLFWEILSSQAGRDLGLATLQHRLFLHPGVVEKIFFDGWLVLGLIASVFLMARKSLKNKSDKFLSLNVFIVFNLLFILATSGENTFHAWYDYMLYPLFVIAIVNLLKTIFAQRNYLLLGAVWVIMLPLFKVGFVHAGVYEKIPALLMRIVMGLGFVPLLLGFLKLKDLAYKYMWLIILLLVLANIGVILVFNQVSYWEMDAGFRGQWCADLF
jgi:4-amino-4-deoxy-L-arabinose transferase-like glycosyltransferase